MPGGVGSDRYRRSPASASSSSSAASSRTWPSWTPASSVSSPAAARASSITPTDRSRRSRNRRARSTSAGRSVCHRPRRRMSGSFEAASSASSSGVSSTSPIASRQSNDAIASRVRMPLDGPAGVVATRLTLMRLAVATHSRGRRTGTPSCSSRGSPSRMKAPTCAWSSSTALGGSPRSSMPALSRTGAISCSRSSSARRGSLSRRNANTSSLPSRSRLAGSASVGSSAASSQSSRTTAPSPAPASGSSRRRPRFHGARERRERPSSTHDASRRSSAG